MPRTVRWKGQNIRRPGAYTWHDLSGLANLDLGVDQSIIIIGEAEAGEPQASAASPVYHAFTDPQDMIDEFIDGNLAECAIFAFDPAADGQQESGVPIGGAQKVYCIKTNQSTQASLTLQDAAGPTNCVTLKDRIWGTKGNHTWAKVEAAGTGITVTCGRAIAPNIGEQVSSSFGVNGTDEWLSVIYTGLEAACALSYDGTTITTVTGGATDQLAITTADKTMEEVIAEINAAHSGVYTATLLREERASTLADYLDEVSGINVKVLASFHGVAWDVVEWHNASSSYCEATWVRGLRPNTLAQTWLAGGTLGTSTANTIQAALQTAKKLPSRFIVSAFNDDIAGPITLDTINGYFTTHLNKCNPVGGKRERQGFGCTNSVTKAALYTELAGYNNQYWAVVNHECYREGPSGAKAWIGCHGSATTAAAIMAGSPIATPLTAKVFKAQDMRYVAADFDVDEDDDYNSASDGGLLMAEQGDLGFQFSKGISTYKTEDNDMLILLEGVEAILWTCIMLRRKFERPNIGHKSRGNVTAEDLQGQAIEVFRALSDMNNPDFVLIEGKDSDGNIVAPFRNVRAFISGDQIYVRAEVTYTTGINYIFTELRATYPTALAA